MINCTHRGDEMVDLETLDVRCADCKKVIRYDKPTNTFQEAVNAKYERGY